MQAQNIIVGIFIISLIHYLSGVLPLPFSSSFKITLLALSFCIPYFKWIILTLFIIYSYQLDSDTKSYFKKIINELEEVTFLKVKLLHCTAFISFIYMIANTYIFIAPTLINSYKNYSSYENTKGENIELNKSILEDDLTEDWIDISNDNPVTTLKIGLLKILIDFKYANLLDIKILNNKSNHNLWISLNKTSNFKLLSNNVWKINLEDNEKLDTICNEKIKYFRYRYKKLNVNELELILESSVKNGIKIQKTFVLNKDSYEIKIIYNIINVNDKKAVVQLFNEFLFENLGESNIDNNKYKLLNPKMTVFSEFPDNKKTFFGYKSLPKSIQFLLDDKKDHIYAGKSYKNGAGFIWAQSPFSWYYSGSGKIGQNIKLSKTDGKILIESFIDPINIDNNNHATFEEKYYFGPLENSWINSRCSALENSNGSSFLGFSLHSIISKSMERFLEKTYFFLKNNYTNSVGFSMLMLGALFFIVFILPLQILYMLVSNYYKKYINFNLFNIIYFIFILFIESRGFVLINKLFCNSINTFMERFLWIEDLYKPETIPILFTLFIIVLNLPVNNIRGMVTSLNQNSNQNNLKKMQFSHVLFISTAYCLFKASKLNMIQDISFCPNYFWYLIVLKIFSPSLFSAGIEHDKNAQGMDNGVGVLSMIIMGSFSDMLRPPLLIFQISKKITELFVMQIITTLGFISKK